MTIFTSLGPVQITGSAAGIERIAFVRKSVSAGMVPSCVRTCARQLKEYFGGKGRGFSGLKLHLAGTAFQRKVWEELRRIPFGKTVTYGDLARRIGHPRAAQAVGSAVRGNPLAIVIPCHRVVPSGGGIGKYAGGERRKRWLLTREAL